MSEAPDTHLNSNDDTVFRLNKINKIEDYFNSKIIKEKRMSKNLNKYIPTFDYFDQTLIVLSETCKGISIIFILISNIYYFEVLLELLWE